MIGRFDESEFFRLLKGRLDERTSRLVAAAAAGAVARDGVGGISAASGYSRSELRSSSTQLAGANRGLRRKRVVYAVFFCGRNR